MNLKVESMDAERQLRNPIALEVVITCREDRRASKKLRIFGMKLKPHLEN